MIHKQLKEYKKTLENYVSGLGIIGDFDDHLVEAFTHKSYAYDHIGYEFHNERLEFVGDAILAGIISKKLFEDYPEKSEYELTLMKIFLVREESLAKVAKEILLPKFIILGKGETKSSGHLKDKILCDCLEALLGYIYIYQGFEQSQFFVLKYIYRYIEDINTTKNYKTILQEYVQSLYKNVPKYVDSGFEFDSKGGVLVYKSEVFIEGKKYGEGFGASKRKAQEQAAQKVYSDMLI